MKITMKKYCKKDYGECHAEMCAARRQPAVKRSDVSINEIRSKANPHPGACPPCFCDGLLTQAKSANTDSSENIYFLSLWASIHTKLIVFTPEKQITIKCLYSHKIVCQTPILCDQILWKAKKEPRPAGSEQNPNICVKMMSTFSPHQMFMVRTVAVCYSFVNLWEKYGGQESSTQCNIGKHMQIDKRRC